MPGKVFNHRLKQYFKGKYVAELFSQTKGCIKPFAANTLIIVYFFNNYRLIMNLLQAN